MKLLHLALLVLLLVCTYGVCGDSQADDSFDMFVFALSWPGGACNSLRPCSVPATVHDFTIHGLWPNKLTGAQGPFNCASAPSFNYTLIQDMRSDLDKYWTDYKNDAPNLWKHEYDKHGTCTYQLAAFSSDVLRDYFKNSLDLRKKMSIITAMKTGGVIPSNSTTYKMSQIKDSLKAGGFGQPALVCFNKTILTEVRFCTDKSLSFIDCPTQVGDQCGQEITFPTLTALPSNTTGVILGLFAGFIGLLIVGFIAAILIRYFLYKKKENYGSL